MNLLSLSEKYLDALPSDFLNAGLVIQVNQIRKKVNDSAR
jgi:hypothetical protein